MGYGGDGGDNGMGRDGAGRGRTFDCYLDDVVCWVCGCGETL
jgi:hypothetical protein